MAQTLRAARSPAETGARRRWAGLGVLATAQFMVVLDATIVNIAPPDIGTGLHMATSSLAWVITAYVIAFGGLLPLGGRLSDLLGRRRVFAVGTGVFAAASLAGGLAQNAVMLVATRADGAIVTHGSQAASTRSPVGQSGGPLRAVNSRRNGCR